MKFSNEIFEDEVDDGDEDEDGDEEITCDQDPDDDYDDQNRRQYIRTRFESDEDFKHMNSQH